MTGNGQIASKLRTVSRRLWRSAGFVEILPWAVYLGWMIVGDPSRELDVGLPWEWWVYGAAWAALVLLLLGLATAIGSWALEAVEGESQSEATRREQLAALLIVAIGVLFMIYWWAVTHPAAVDDGYSGTTVRMMWIIAFGPTGMVTMMAVIVLSWVYSPPGIGRARAGRRAA